MIRTIFVSLLFKLVFFNTLIILAQDTNHVQKDLNRYIIIKTNISSLMDYTPAIQFSYQYNFYKRWHLQHEAGYHTHFVSPYWNSDSQFEGYRIKNQIKYYLPVSINSNDYFYLAGEFMIKHISYYEERFFGMYDNAYFQEIRYKKEKDIQAYSLIMGFEPLINTKLVIDFYAGFGYRRLKITESIPEEANTIGWGLFRRDEGTYHLPGIYFGFRLGYKFNSFF